MHKIVIYLLLATLLIAGCAALPAESALQPTDDGAVVLESDLQPPPPGETSPAQGQGAGADPAHGGDSGQAPTKAGGADEAAPTLEVPVNDPKVELPHGAVLRLQRSGGFAGLDEEWLVYADGRITFRDGNKPQISLQEWLATPEQVEILLETIDELGFFRMNYNGNPGSLCCDRLGMTLSVSYKDFKRSVSIQDGSRGVPELFWKVIDAVDGFLPSVAE